jgi:hypothetical protein
VTKGHYYGSEGYQRVLVDGIIACDHSLVKPEWSGCSTDNPKVLTRWVETLKKNLPGHEVTTEPGRCWGSAGRRA